MGSAGPSLPHLLFPDDSLFFLKASVKNCQVMTQIITSYCSYSGQMVNLDKSSLFFSANTPLDLQLIISEVLGIRVSSDPGKYLGLPTMWGRSKKQALAYVNDRIASKVQGWKHIHLSQAGKEILIKSVLSAIPAYPMSVFLYRGGM